MTGLLLLIVFVAMVYYLYHIHHNLNFIRDLLEIDTDFEVFNSSKKSDF